jgi:hypothetical protein
MWSGRDPAVGMQAGGQSPSVRPVSGMQPVRVGALGHRRLTVQEINLPMTGNQKVVAALHLTW